MTFNTWSKTASSNSSADATVNWTEGQAPSSVNDSARAMMAAAAKYRDDNSGSLVTGGSSTAYTITSNQVFASLSAMNGMSLRVKFHTASGAAPTLNVDGLGAKAISSVAGTAIATGLIVSGAVHDLVYDNSNNCWLLVAGKGEFPSGTIMLFKQTAAPTGWTKLTSDNDAALRVVSGTPSTGGTAGFTTAFAARTILKANLPSYDLTVTDPGHTHPLTNNPMNGNGIGGSFTLTQGGALAVNNTAVAATPNTTGITVSSGGSGTAMDFAVKYVDVIEAQKD
jgi:hypothetical protein